jgi:hypothetical protein
VECAAERVLFDQALVDANHRYDFVANDSASALKAVKPDGGLIVWEDFYHSSGRNFDANSDPSVCKDLNDVKKTDWDLLHTSGTPLVVGGLGLPSPSDARIVQPEEISVTNQDLVRYRGVR